MFILAVRLEELLHPLLPLLHQLVRVGVELLQPNVLYNLRGSLLPVEEVLQRPLLGPVIGETNGALSGQPRRLGSDLHHRSLSGLPLSPSLHLLDSIVLDVINRLLGSRVIAFIATLITVVILRIFRNIREILIAGLGIIEILVFKSIRIGLR